jgi:SAM-dependent methyltransferase
VRDAGRALTRVSLRDRGIALARRYLSPATREWIVRQQRKYRVQWPRVGTVRFGDFYRTTPISPIFGIDRGVSVERYYVERFLDAHRSDVRGHCLEVGDPTYIEKFGDGRVTRIDVLHVVPGNPKATLVADLTCADHVPSHTFDCIIFTQTMQMIYDIRTALGHVHRILKPGGVLLATSHGISRIGRRLGRDPWGEYWHITTQAAERLFAETFPGARIEVGSYGNVLAAVCALHGVVSDEIATRDLDHHDPDFEVLVTIRAQKAICGSSGQAAARGVS